MAMGSSYGSGKLSGEINVTPLIDVLLVLLIIFMVIVPITPQGLDAQVPHRSTPDQSSELAVVVQVVLSRDGQLSYKLNREDISISDLHLRLNTIFSTRANKVMFIQGDDYLDFSAIAQIVDIAKGAGADRIGLITPKDRV